MGPKVAAYLLFVAALLIAGCENVSIRGKQPELSKSERRIVERRKLHGKETTVHRDDWRYDSADDKWNWEPHSGSRPGL